MVFIPSRSIDAAAPDAPDAPYAQKAQELATPLVDLSVDRLPASGQNKNIVMSSMVLDGMKEQNQGLIGVSNDTQVILAKGRNSFEEQLKVEFPEKYKMLKDNAKNLRLELCLPPNASLEKIAEQLYKLRQGEISRYSCRRV